MWLRDIEGVLSAADLQRTVEHIAQWQLPNGMIPWFPGGHADPWNHVEAAMALDLVGLRAEAERLVAEEKITVPRATLNVIEAAGLAAED